MYFYWIIDGLLPDNVYVRPQPIKECGEVDYPDAALHCDWLSDQLLQVRLGDQLYLCFRIVDDGIWLISHYFPGHKLRNHD